MHDMPTTMTMIRIRRRIRALTVSVTVLVLASLLISTATARKSLGGGSGLSTWSSSKDEGLFAKAGRGAADAQRRSVLSRLEWVVDPLDADAVRSRAADLGEGGRDCADVVCRYLAGRDPLRLKLRTRPVQKGGSMEQGDSLRAVALVSSRSPKAGRARVGLGLPLVSPTARRIRATWTTTGPRVLSPADQDGACLALDYDSACLTAHSRLEVEVTLPKVRRTGKNPVVVYNFPISQGNMEGANNYITASAGSVRIFPTGRTNRRQQEKDGFQAGKIQSETEEEGGVEVGRASAHVSAGQGLVDPGWAKGRAVWRQGRRVGNL